MKCGDEDDLIDDAMSLDSEKLFELSTYYQKEQDLKLLKDEIQKTKQRIKLPNTTKNMKKLFKKTIDKLKKYKNNQKNLEMRI